MALSEFDRALIEATQAGLPLVARPYEALGALLGVEGERVRERLAEMQAEGLIRRIGAVPNHYRLGWVANGMSVWDVDDARVDEQSAGPEWLLARAHQFYQEGSVARQWSVRPGETRQLEASVLGWRWDRVALAAALGIVLVVVVFVTAALIAR